MDGQDAIADVHEVLEKVYAFARRVRSGEWVGITGKPVKTVVNVGIGGSDLGPLMMCTALKPSDTPGLNMHFVSNVDGSQLRDVLSKVHPETTLFIIASKTFTTQETLTNALTARKWFLDHAGDESAVAKHFVAVSTNQKAVAEFGIDTANMFEFWDWVGGRYSLWSAIGLPIMLYLGEENFIEMLNGAHLMDQHFINTPLERNMPVILALIGIWYINLLRRRQPTLSQPYDQSPPTGLPKFIQQLDMESNGKQVTLDGKPVGYETSPIIGAKPVSTASTHSSNCCTKVRTSRRLTSSPRLKNAAICKAITKSCWPTSLPKPKPLCAAKPQTKSAPSFKPKAWKQSASKSWFRTKPSQATARPTSSLWTKSTRAIWAA